MRQKLRRPRERFLKTRKGGLRRRIIRESQLRDPTRSDEQRRTIEDFESQRLDRSEHVQDGMFPGSRPLHGTRVNLNVRQQVVRQGDQLCHALLAA
jgi:hypothetical protein